MGQIMVGYVDDETISTTIYLEGVNEAKAKFIEIAVPSKAKAGDVVTINTKIKNIGTANYTLYFSIYEPVSNSVSRDEGWVNVGETKSFSLTIVMPNRDLSINLTAGHYTP